MGLCKEDTMSNSGIAFRGAIRALSLEVALASTFSERAVCAYRSANHEEARSAPCWTVLTACS